MSQLLDQVRNLIRIRHYSYRTEQTYIHWIKQFILFHNKRHPAEIGAEKVNWCAYCCPNLARYSEEEMKALTISALTKLPLN